VKRKARAVLEATVRSTRAPFRAVQRAKIILAADGVPNLAIERKLGITDDTVRKWRDRFAQSGAVACLDDEPRSGRPALIPVDVRCHLIKLACQRCDEERAPFRDVWTHAALGDALADETGLRLSRSEIGRILRTADLRPHRMKLWLHGPDPEFQPKVERICRLYTQSLEGATLLCVDEKTCTQALARRFPGRASRRGRVGRREFEYKRHSTATLLGAFDVHTGQVYGECRVRRTAADLGECMAARGATCTSSGTTSTSTMAPRGSASTPPTAAASTSSTRPSTPPG
jgi:transposase